MLHGKNNLAPRSLVDEAEAIAKRAAERESELANGWNDNVGGAPINLAPTGTVIASQSTTPRVSGRYLVWGSATFTTTGAPSAGLLSLGHNGAIDYDQGSGVTLEANNTGRNDSISTILGPFPLNVAVTLDLFGRAGGGGAQIPSDHSAQIAFVELPN